MKSVRYALEGFGLLILFCVFRCLPWRVASGFGGWIGRVVGARLAASRKAKRNLEAALPDIDADDVICGMWDNLGRVVAEYPHLKTIAAEHTVIEGGEHIKDGDRCLFIAAHLGNWELNCIAPMLQRDLQIDITYRAPNNPFVDRMLMRMRSQGGRLRAHAKSREGGMSLLKAIKAGRHVGILIDQKYNEGVDVPFFGREAMTNPIFVQLAKKHGLKLIPVQNIRLEDGSFKLIVNPAMDLDKPLEDVIADAHGLLEGWISERPEQWLWLHRRWKD
ncbi:MAG: lysophospholipid acyltransferase family protein [Alphaproteobacteria bacterium]